MEKYLCIETDGLEFEQIYSTINKENISNTA